MLIPSSFSRYYRTVLPEVVFHPESGAKSGQFCPKWFSIRNQGQNPDSSARSGFSVRNQGQNPDSSVRNRFSIRNRRQTPDSSVRSGFPSGIGGKIRTVLSEADFHPESGAKSGQFPKFFISIRSVNRTGFEFDIHQPYF